MRLGVVVGAAVMLWTTYAVAQPAGAKGKRDYVVKFKKIADDCPASTVKFGIAQVTIAKFPRRRGRMAMGTWRLNGKLNRARFSMTAKRPGAVITASGAVRKGALSMLVIAEHYRGKTPVCTQTWNAKGKRGKLRRAP